ncbi:MULTISPECIES: hypothetical protein [Pseudomonas syringae group]|uniref:hypothetical protein n=1 Tax=Pseudomonas syringae group TaxID=136849 RepID=UPI0009B2C409|nr:MULTISPECIES: hypothetical protein [Pseudomonas syringae group]
MKNRLDITAALLSILALAGCEKTSEDHAREATQHEAEARAHSEKGNNDQASQSSLKAKAAYSRAKEAAATEDRHLPPDSDVPKWIKATE